MSAVKVDIAAKQSVDKAVKGTKTITNTLVFFLQNMSELEMCP
jgi:hypothetical protein